MTLTSKELHTGLLTKGKFGGYTADSVDNIIELASESLADLESEIESLEAKIKEFEPKAKLYDETRQEMADAIDYATKARKENVILAEGDAKVILEEANREAKHILENAQASYNETMAKINQSKKDASAEIATLKANANTEVEKKLTEINNHADLVLNTAKIEAEELLIVAKMEAEKITVEAQNAAKKVMARRNALEADNQRLASAFNKELTKAISQSKHVFNIVMSQLDGLSQLDVGSDKSTEQKSTPVAPAKEETPVESAVQFDVKEKPVDQKPVEVDRIISTGGQSPVNNDKLMQAIEASNQVNAEMQELASHKSHINSLDDARELLNRLDQ